MRDFRLSPAWLSIFFGPCIRRYGTTTLNRSDVYLKSHADKGTEFAGTPSLRLHVGASRRFIGYPDGQPAAGPSLQFLVPTRGVEPRPPRSQRGMHNRYTCAGMLAGEEGFEPSTFAFRVRCAASCAIPQ